MADKTKIFLTSGHEVEVEEEPSQVLDALIRSEPFHKLRGKKADVYVAAGSVAYIQQVPPKGPAKVR